MPSFSWGGSEGLSRYDFDKSVELAQIVMARRNVEFTARHRTLFRAASDLAKQVEEGSLLL
jgi:hypothetical protein